MEPDGVEGPLCRYRQCSMRDAASQMPKRLAYLHACWYRLGSQLQDQKESLVGSFVVRVRYCKTPSAHSVKLSEATSDGKAGASAIPSSICRTIWLPPAPRNQTSAPGWHCSCGFAERLLWVGKMTSPQNAPQLTAASSPQRCQGIAHCYTSRQRFYAVQQFGSSASSTHETLRICFASSPLPAISCTMSEPPTNSPPMYSCGMVGHAENSLILSRRPGL